MFACIRILDDKIYDIEMIDNEAQRSVGRLHCRVLLQAECREDSGDQRGIERDQVEHSAVGSIG